jgi:hypothetical protein
MQWKVTDRDGTVSTFKTIGALAGLSADGTSADLVISNKWLLSSVTDMHGNAVNYAYDCSELVASRLTGACYPSTITYQSTAVSSASAVITFYREARPDFILMANGIDITVTKQRVKTISIKVGSTLRGAYALRYDQALFSNTSRLVAVDRYGTNASVDATSGAVSAATAAKHIAVLDYQDVGRTYHIGSLTDLRLEATGGGGGISSFSPGRPVDLNFDDQDELIGVVAAATTETTPGGSSGGDTITRHDLQFAYRGFGAAGGITANQTIPLNVSFTTPANPMPGGYPKMSVVRVFGTIGGVSSRRLWPIRVFILGGCFSVKQAAVSDGFAFDPFPFQHDDVTAPEVDVGGGVRLPMLSWYRRWLYCSTKPAICRLRSPGRK